MVGEGADLPWLLPNWERWLGKGLGATIGKGGCWDLSMGTLASGRPAERPLGSSLGPQRLDKPENSPEGGGWLYLVVPPVFKCPSKSPRLRPLKLYVYFFLPCFLLCSC